MSDSSDIDTEAAIEQMKVQRASKLLVYTIKIAEWKLKMDNNMQIYTAKVKQSIDKVFIAQMELINHKYDGDEKFAMQEQLLQKYKKCVQQLEHTCKHMNHLVMKVVRSEGGNNSEIKSQVMSYLQKMRKPLLPIVVTV